MPLTFQSSVGPECPWVRGLPPPCRRQPVPGLQVVKGSSASWCHCVPFRYCEACVSQHHVPLSSHRGGLDTACRWPVGFSQDSSLLAQLVDALLLLPLAPSRSSHTGPVPQPLAHETDAAWQMGKEGTAPWPCSLDHHLSSHRPTGLFSALARHGGSCLLPPSFPNPLPKTSQGGEAGTSRYPKALSAWPFAGTEMSPVPFCTPQRLQR